MGTFRIVCVCLLCAARARAQAGVLLHMFDGLEALGRPWEACEDGCYVQARHPLTHDATHSSLTALLSTACSVGPLILTS